MKRIITPLAITVALGLGSSTAFAAEKKEEAVKLSETPSAVQKTVNEKAAGGKIVRMEKEQQHGKTVYEAVISKDGKETGIEVAANGKYLRSHDETQESKTMKK